MKSVSTEDQQILDALRSAVTEALERKRRLGQYAVIWQDGKPVIIGGESSEMVPSDQATIKPAPSELRIEN